jgi:hypothetical protein
MKAHSIAHAIVVALLIAPASLAGQVRKSTERVPLSAEPRSLISMLAGTWRFNIYSSTNTDPVSSGQRVMRLLSDSMKLAWTETFGDRADTGTGVFGYNSATAAYYVFGAYTDETDPFVLTGRADGSGDTILFDPLEGLGHGGNLIASSFHLLDPQHFEWIASDGRWRAVFTRVGHS